MSIYIYTYITYIYLDRHVLVRVEVSGGSWLAAPPGLGVLWTGAAAQMLGLPSGGLAHGQPSLLLYFFLGGSSLTIIYIYIYIKMDPHFGCTPYF